MSATIAEMDTTSLHTMEELRSHVVSLIKTPNPFLYDLGCGQKPAKGFVGVDLYASVGVRADLFAPVWDFVADDSCDMLYASHFLEHVPDLDSFMSNAWRKLKDGGFFLINTPYGHSPRAWQDPDHKRPIFRETYWYFNAAARKRMGVEHYYGSADFDMVDVWPVWNKKYAARAEANPQLVEDFLAIFGACDDLTVLLRARKGRSDGVDESK